MKKLAGIASAIALASSPAIAQDAQSDTAAQDVLGDTGVKGVNPAELNDRADVIVKAVNLPVGESIAVVAKYDMKLGNGLGANLEMPVLSYVNTTGIDATGTGDLFARIRYVKPLSRQVFVLGALETVVPIASSDVHGTGKWQLNPAVGAVYMWNFKSFSAVLYKRFQSIAGDDDRSDIHQNQVRALHTFVLGKGWYVTGDVKYDFETVARNEDWWTTEVELGKQLNARWASSLRLGKSYGDRKNKGTVEFNVRTFF